jgi:hypothetical protein
MLAAIIRVKQLSRVCGAGLCNRNNACRWRFHYSIDLIVAVEGEANFGVEKANNG